MTARALLLALLLAACGSPDPAPQNPKQLWLAPNGSELQLKLAAIEPNPF